MVPLGAWRKSGGTPTPADHAREDEFLEQHVSGGALIHVTTVDALAAKLADETDEAERARLTLRVFAEYVNALETLGAWGWAIRERRSSRLLLDAFLSYQPSDVGRFYAAVSSHNGELADLLRLPPTETITDAFRAGGAPHGPLLADFARVEANLGQAAEHYFRPDALFVTNYNKAKHGAPIIRDSTLAPAEFYVLAPDRSDGTGRYQFTKFSTKPESIAKIVGLTKATSETCRALVSFARNLKTVRLLYVETIYVALLDERTDVWRPVEAQREGTFYRIVGPVPDEEKWAFDPGSLVRCELRVFADGQGLVAVESV